MIDDEREWEATFDAIDQGVIVLDLEGRVRRINQVACDLLNVARSSSWPTNLPLKTLTVGNFEPWRTVNGLLGDPEETSATAYDPTNDRTYAVTKRRLGTELSLTVITVRDISDIIELERSAHLGETLASMGALVAGVAHEVRNPLFGISATLDAFELTLGDDPEHGEYVRVLREQVNRLSALMAELLDYGRPMPLELERVAAMDVAAVAIETCAVLADAADVRIDLDIPSSLGPMLADRKRVVQVLVNLLENALQHSRAGDTVTIAARESIQDERAWIDLSVSDRGSGFSEGDLPRIFDPFFTRRRGGTGLGLALVRRIMFEHRGSVFAANRAGGGAIVMVRVMAPTASRSIAPKAL